MRAVSRLSWSHPVLNLGRSCFEAETFREITVPESFRRQTRSVVDFSGSRAGVLRKESNCYLGISNIGNS